jgi:hypothetical protein
MNYDQYSRKDNDGIPVFSSLQVLFFAEEAKKRGAALEKQRGNRQPTTHPRMRKKHFLNLEKNPILIRLFTSQKKNGIFPPKTQLLQKIGKCKGRMLHFSQIPCKKHFLFYFIQRKNILGAETAYSLLLIFNFGAFSQLLEVFF